KMVLKAILEDTYNLMKVIKRGREVVSGSIAERICDSYKQLSLAEKETFFNMLVSDHGVAETTKIGITLDRSNPVESIQRLQNLRHITQPQFAGLFRVLGKAQGGVKFMVNMRTDLSKLTGKSTVEATPAIVPVIDHELKQLLSVWFSSGLFHLQRATWESPSRLLEKVAASEAVHPILGWQDLKRRVGAYKRCFVFTHPCLPGEPLVILHAALLENVADTMEKIVPALFEHMPDSVEDPARVKVANFYSISRPIDGLSGIDLGSNIVRRVMHRLQAEYPKLQHFSSLSPIPGFNNWLFGQINRHLQHEVFARILDDVRPESSDLLPLFSDETHVKMMQLFDVDNNKDLYTKLSMTLESQEWITSPVLVSELKQPLMKLCARYLFALKHRGHALDPIANFHLRNGAVMYRLCWQADQSPNGLSQSCGMMVNYRYYPELTEGFSEKYYFTKRIPVGEPFASVISIEPDSLPLDP
ncbi:hypothetical protein BOX15_Mlig003902g1, partial [Macrostomum lignano]